MNIWTREKYTDAAVRMMLGIEALDINIKGCVAKTTYRLIYIGISEKKIE